MNRFFGTATKKEEVSLNDTITKVIPRFFNDTNVLKLIRSSLMEESIQLK